jgi:hypothetical protein
MKNKIKFIQMAFIASGFALSVGGCSSGQKSGQDIMASGPTITNVEAKPSTVELNRNLMPDRAPEILADVKDFKSTIQDVKLKFTHVPIQVPMQNIGGTTWRGVLTSKQLQSLAIAGKTAKYDASVVARNEQGQMAVSEKPVTISVKAPDLARNVG